MNHRIWELDAIRGICILGMVLVHYVFDLIDLLNLVSWSYPPIILFFLNWGGIFFLVLSGVCVTIGRKHIRRGIFVLFCGLMITFLTYGMHRLGFASKNIVIYFGILHCLGTCMILWQIFQRLSNWTVAVAALPMIALGLYLDTVTPAKNGWLLPLGILPPTIATADYFPLLPNLGYFLLGTFLGRMIYRKPVSLLPEIDPQIPILRFFRFCGRHSLAIYLLHQPIFFGILLLWKAI